MKAKLNQLIASLLAATAISTLAVAQKAQDPKNIKPAIEAPQATACSCPAPYQEVRTVEQQLEKNQAEKQEMEAARRKLIEEEEKQWLHDLEFTRS